MEVTSSSLTLGFHVLITWSVHLTRYHVARMYLGLGSGTSLMDVLSRSLLRHQQHFIETETMMETSTCSECTEMSCLQLEGSVVRLKMQLLLTKPSV